MAIMNNFASGGAPTDELTATPAEVMKGYKFLGAGSDEEQTGTLELTGNAAVNHVLQGETFYNTNPKNKLTGTMTVNSIFSFKAQVVSGRQILFTWQNPTTATGKPFSGVCINYSTSGYPGTGGTRLYTGVGSNSASGGTSQAYLNLPNLNTAYYFSCYSFVNINNNADNKYGTVFNASATTGGNISLTFTQSQDYTIPGGFTLLDVFLVGGGNSGIRGSGIANNWKYAGDGGGGGYTKTQRNIGIAGGQVLRFNVGGGGGFVAGLAYNQSGQRTFNVGGVSSVVRSGSVLATVNGGNDFNGGSGGGAYGEQVNFGEDDYRHYVGNGGSNGGNGGSTLINRNGTTRPGGAGQGFSTRAWDGTGAQYSAGGGGGAQPGARLAGSGGSGGSPGGGKGGNAWGGGTNGESGGSGSANTGSGGGGGGGCSTYKGFSGASGGGGAGGSGIILAILH